MSIDIAKFCVFFCKKYCANPAKLLIRANTSYAFTHYSMLFLCPAALRTAVSDYARITADRVSVNRVVHRAVTYAGLLHAADYLLKCVEVLERVAVELDIADMSRVGKCVIGCFELDLVECRDMVIYRDME